MKRLAAVLALLAILAACTERNGSRPPIARPSVAGSHSARPAGSASPSVVPTPSPVRPVFRAEVAPIDEPTRRRMRFSWRPGCPVPLGDLRLLTIGHWGFDGKVRSGELVVHRDVADEVVRVFGVLFGARFPIERMELVDVYAGDDDRSMAANNTSAFNCRRSSGDAAEWSEHAYGRAVDINPVLNPYVSSSGVEPPAGRRYLDRSADVPGLIRRDGVVVQAFEAIGWPWGGEWSSAKDYQHFSSTGR